jgi:hypothetical protein
MLKLGVNEKTYLELICALLGNAYTEGFNKCGTNIISEMTIGYDKASISFSNESVNLKIKDFDPADKGFTIPNRVI